MFPMLEQSMFMRWFIAELVFNMMVYIVVQLKGVLDRKRCSNGEYVPLHCFVEEWTRQMVHCCQCSERREPWSVCASSIRMFTE